MSPGAVRIVAPPVPQALLPVPASRFRCRRIRRVATGASDVGSCCPCRDSRFRRGLPNRTGTPVRGRRPQSPWWPVPSGCPARGWVEADRQRVQKSDEPRPPQVVPPKFGPGLPRLESRLGPLTSGPQPRRTTLVRLASCPPTRGRRKSGGPDPSRLAGPSQDLSGRLSVHSPYGLASPSRGLVSHPSRGRAEPAASAGTLGDASQGQVQLRRETVIRRLNAPKFTGLDVAVGPVARTFGRDFGR